MKPRTRTIPLLVAVLLLLPLTIDTTRSGEVVGPATLEAQGPRAVAPPPMVTPECKVCWVFPVDPNCVVLDGVILVPGVWVLPA